MAKADDTRPPPAAKDILEPLLAMARRRGIVAPAYELYGGTAGFYEYGPLGAALKRNFEDLWRRHYVLGEGFGEIHSPTISPEPVFRASGHLASFADLLIECPNPNCKQWFRADHFLGEEFDRLEVELEAAIGKAKKSYKGVATPLDEVAEWVRNKLNIARASIAHGIKEEKVHDILCLPQTAANHQQTAKFGQIDVKFCNYYFQIRGGPLEAPIEHAIRCGVCNNVLGNNPDTKTYPFNLMFKTNVGPGAARPGYLRPETAQGMFVNFTWLYRYHRDRLPFGAVQIGKAYRNEIAPRQALIRLREFHQAELEYFCDPDDKRHPRLASVADLRLPLVPNEGEPGSWRLGDAVAKGIIANETIAYFVGKTFQILTDAGLAPARIRFRQHLKDEMAHYASDCWDAEYHSARFGWVECVGIADRGSYDLERHAEVSGQPLTAFRRFDVPREMDVTRVTADMKRLGPLFKGEAAAVAEACAQLAPERIPASGTVRVPLEDRTVEVPVEALRVERVRERAEGEQIVPHVVEPSYGVDRILMAALEHAYDDSGEWVVLRLTPEMAPIKCGVFPLLGKDGLPERATDLDRALRDEGVATYYDEGGSIGRRYARMDEVGTPYCVTIDHDTLADGTVTIRERDSQTQKRVAARDVPTLVGALVRGKRAFASLP